MNRVVGACVSWAIALLLAWLGVLDIAHCLLLAGCVTALLLVWPRVLPLPPHLPEIPHHSHPGARRDLSDLSWSVIDRDGRASTKALVRLRALTDFQNPSPSPTEVLRWLDTLNDKEKHD